MEQISAETMDNYERGKDCFGIVSVAELRKNAEILEIGEAIVLECERVRQSKFESHEGFDLICLHIPRMQGKEPLQVCIYFRDELLLFVTNRKERVEAFMEADAPGLPRLLYSFLDRLTREDILCMEQLEEEISTLEEALITSKIENCINEIVGLRKRLLSFKRYYEQLLSILESLEENENRLLTQKWIRYFKMLTGRVDRLYHSVLNLGDYVSQVRETYQSQVDIRLNNIMKLFTVITAICLPLTLVAGWYGMNFNMPEYHWRYGYPAVCLLSIAVVGICILWFRKNKWF